MIPNANEVGVLPESPTNQGNNFICGVVEGFYGQPWTMDQRRKLFARMSAMGMNTYIYAPKDDLKHRMHWRDLYTVDEAEPLTTMIDEAREHGVTFVYALSPGIDITYSSTKEISCLKHKLEQVASFGCEAFALLFDDIEVELCDSDKSLFQSFAAAQVSVTNEVYQHMRQPLRFFFCPTEYCASRAIPSVSQSEYLNTVGSKLLPDIEVMWTGPKVISKRISIHSIEELTRVLRRKPLIWDNIHANDYDSKRLFLGPYDGRSPKLVPYLRGVLTNPNCEFESDFVAMHTLAQWSRASMDGGKKDLFNGGPMNADVRLETEGSSDGGSNNSSGTEDEDVPDEPIDNSPVEYTPRLALRRAISAWLPEFFVPTQPLGSLLRKTPIGVIPTIPPVMPIPAGNKAVDQMALLEVTDGYVQPLPAAVPTSSLVELSSESETSSTVSSTAAEPMDCIITPGSTPASDSVATSVEEGTTVNSAGDEEVDSDDNAIQTPPTSVVNDTITPAEKMQVDSDSSSTTTSTATTTITSDDVATIVDLFYLPFEHGPRAARLLTDFFWIKTHAVDALSDAPESTCDPLLGSVCCDDCDGPPSPGGKPTDESRVQVDEWREQVRTFLIRLRWTCDTIDRVLTIPNRALAYELFPYLWDVKSALYLLDSFVQWLGANKFYRDQLVCRSQEPWLFRGGLLGEIQRLLPFESAPDLLFYPYPAGPQSTMYRIRPYKPTDKEAVYKVCLQTSDDGADGSHLYPGCPELLADRLIGPFLEYSANSCFVITDNRGSVCGYVVTAHDAASFNETVASHWVPFLTQKYPMHGKTDSEDLTPAELIVSDIHGPSKRVGPPSDRYTSLLRIDVVRQHRDSVLGDPTAVKRALASAAIALKVTGSKGMYTTVDAKHASTIETYRTLGFVDVPMSDCIGGICVMGRPL